KHVAQGLPAEVAYTGEGIEQIIAQPVRGDVGEATAIEVERVGDGDRVGSRRLTRGQLDDGLGENKEQAPAQQHGGRLVDEEPGDHTDHRVERENVSPPDQVEMQQTEHEQPGHAGEVNALRWLTGCVGPLD